MISLLNPYVVVDHSVRNKQIFVMQTKIKDYLYSGPVFHTVEYYIQEKIEPIHSRMTHLCKILNKLH